MDLVASSSGYHEPMGQEIRDRLRKQRGTLVYAYNVEDFTLLHIFESKQHMYDTINIHHKTLSSCRCAIKYRYCLFRYFFLFFRSY